MLELDTFQKGASKNFIGVLEIATDFIYTLNADIINELKAKQANRLLKIHHRTAESQSVSCN